MPSRTTTKHCSAPVEDIHGDVLRTVRQLRSGMSLDDFCDAYKLTARHHPQLPLVQLSYDQRASDVANAVVQECRGLLLEKNTWRVVMMPFSKFFNADEPNAKATREAFDWSTARVYEKLDGSLTTLYWYGGCWHVASMRLPAADGEVPGSSGGTFACIFWKAFAAAGFSLPIAPAAQQRCFMFELCLPGHTIVVRHATASLSLIGARDLVRLEELDVEVVGAEYGWTTPARLPAPVSLAAVQAAARALNPVEHEGYVAVDGCFRRLKVKSPSYVALHHIGELNLRKDCGAEHGGAKRRKPLSEEQARMQRRRLLEVARCREGDEFLAYFPTLRANFRTAVHELASLGTHLSRCLMERPAPTAHPALRTLTSRAEALWGAEDGCPTGGALTKRAAKREQTHVRAKAVAAKVIYDSKIAEVEEAIDQLKMHRSAPPVLAPRAVQQRLQREKAKNKETREDEDEDEDKDEDEDEDEDDEDEDEDATKPTISISALPHATPTAPARAPPPPPASRFALLALEDL
eukprot:jgi/Chrpa1/7882/Chrysochromulina_OHIO_Genome00017712-RA